MLRKMYEYIPKENQGSHEKDTDRLNLQQQRVQSRRGCTKECVLGGRGCCDRRDFKVARRVKTK